MLDFLWFILIGLAAGWIAGSIFKGSGFGLLWNIVIGIIGGALGGWLFGFLGIAIRPPLLGALIAAVAGAVLLLWIISLFKRKA